MFSGIVGALGKVKIIEKNDIYNVALHVEKVYLPEFLSKDNPIKIGSSISCSGICLTVKENHNNLLFFDVSDETVSKTNFSEWKVGTYVNLERSLRIGDEIGGHFVSGHIDDVSIVKNIFKVDDSRMIQLSLKKKLSKFIAVKGSVTLNGVSLTVNNIKNNFFEVNIVPFTWNKTNLSFLKNGSIVNLEVDLLARYLLNLK